MTAPLLQFTNVTKSFGAVRALMGVSFTLRPGEVHALVGENGTIRPMPPSPKSNLDQPPIDWVRARYDSMHGRISSAWRREGERFELEIQIPANTMATVYLPGQDIAGVTEAGKGLAHAKGIKFLRKEGDRIVLAVESGAYQFVVKPRL